MRKSDGGRNGHYEQGDTQETSGLPPTRAKRARMTAAGRRERVDEGGDVAGRSCRIVWQCLQFSVVLGDAKTLEVENWNVPILDVSPASVPCLLASRGYCWRRPGTSSDVRYCS